MDLTIEIKILPSPFQNSLLSIATSEYIRTINSLYLIHKENKRIRRVTSKNIDARIPSCLKAQCVLDAVSMYLSAKSRGTNPKAKKPVAIWNNQNFTIHHGYIRIPFLVDGKCKRVNIKAETGERYNELSKFKLGSLRITQKSGKWIAQIAATVPDPPTIKGQAMGIDLGLKIPAVAVTEDGKTAFFGNGRMNKYMRRKNSSDHKSLCMAKKAKAIKNRNNKCRLWMKDQDHKISRRIIRFASANKVGTIRLEKLSGICQRARTSRKNSKNLHNWPFYRLAKFIEYKSKLAGIKVEYVDPRYTSQKCPACGKLNKAVDRKYKCGCGFKGHRDRVGALNIISAPVVDGKSLPARNAKRTVAGRANGLAPNLRSTQRTETDLGLITQEFDIIKKSEELRSGPLAHGEERLSYKQLVACSSHARPTKLLE